MSYTVLDLITGAMRLIGAISQGEAPSNEEAQTGFEALNLMVDEFNVDRLTLYSVGYSTFGLTAQKATYTIGDPNGSDLRASRPALIQTASIIDSLGLEHPLELINAVQYAALEEKLTSFALVPDTLYDDYAFPVSTLYLNPTPTAAGFQLRFFAWSQFSQFQTLQDDLSFPPGYLKMLKYNLAMNIAPEFAAAADANLQLIGTIAQASKEQIRQFNAQQLPPGIPRDVEIGTSPQRAAVPPQPATPAAPQQ